MTAVNACWLRPRRKPPLSGLSSLKLTVPQDPTLGQEVTHYKPVTGNLPRTGSGVPEVMLLKVIMESSPVALLKIRK